MSQNSTVDSGGSPLFRHGITPALRCIFYVFLACAMLIADHRWVYLTNIRSAVATAILPFQHIMLTPQNAWHTVSQWMIEPIQLQLEIRHRLIEVDPCRNKTNLFLGLKYSKGMAD